jgi:hypothetical protein
MKWVLCLVVGHQKTVMALSSNRFMCRRCGADLGRDVGALPNSPPAVRTHPKPRAADPMRRFLWERPLPDHLAASGMRRRRTRTAMTRPPDPPWSAGGGGADPDSNVGRC